MALINTAPTKSNLLDLRRQLAFAVEGYDLLEQKRQILVFELMSRIEKARAAERRAEEALRGAFDALREATLAMGTAAVDRAALAAQPGCRLEVGHQRSMGLNVPCVAVQAGASGVPFGVGGTAAGADLARRRFMEALPLLAGLAELENAVLRLARELRKTQRRCNALSRIFIPDYRETIVYILGALEERERESLVIFKMIRARLTAGRGAEVK